MGGPGFLVVTARVGSGSGGSARLEPAARLVKARARDLVVSMWERCFRGVDGVGFAADIQFSKC